MTKVNLTDTWRGRIVAYAPLFLWIGVIFFLSSNNGSMEQTSRFIGPLLHFLFPAASEQTLQAYHGYIRKTAHFTEYAMLAIIAIRTFSAGRREAFPLRIALMAILTVAAVAVIDEWNQSYIPTRTGSAADVALDLFGGVSAAAAWLIWKRAAR